ncbi:MAG TPA: hypothetical protein VFJ65_05485 [Solirubrobacterales bacterium]|nr:hypothetical protein [Solirubrobacterales bacterium]
MEGLTYHHLEEKDVRKTMLASWEKERQQMIASEQERGCYGKDLNEDGWQAFLEAMPVALEKETDTWLAAQMQEIDYWQPERWDKRGRWVRYSKEQALEILCIGEFNIAYIRGLALTLQAEGEEECQIYRAGTALEKRRECTEWEGQQFPVQQVLDGHRARYWPPPGNPNAWSLPTGPGCHHSICRVGARQPQQ